MGLAGVGVPAAVVVIAPGAAARLVWLKLKGPPKPPVVTFCTFTVVRLLVKVHEMLAPAVMAAALRVTVRVARLGVAVPAPRPEQVMSVSANPAGGALSVSVVEVASALSGLVVPATLTPAVTVVTVSLPKPLVPVKSKVPVPPCETLLMVTRGAGAKVRSSIATI